MNDPLWTVHCAVPRSDLESNYAHNLVQTMERLGAKNLFLIFLFIKALPALAAGIIQARMSARYGVRVGVIAIPHTFNGKLEFNPHVHTMVTGGRMHGANVWI